MKDTELSRRTFVERTVAVGAVLAAAPLATARSEDKPAEGKRIRVGLIGCGSVSGSYLPQLANCKFATVVSLCDIIPERAERRAKEFKVAKHYPNIDAMLAGVEFDLLVNLTDMQEHEQINRRAVEAGKHIWSEKPIANSLVAGQAIVEAAKKKGLRVWGAPVVVQSPQFAFMAKTIASGAMGRIAAAHADYGHEGPNWSSFFYEKLGGSMPDLGVYNLTTLTGLLGPARSVVAMTSIVNPNREITNKGKISVTEEDNAMILLDHGKGIISHIQSGFNYFNLHGHDGSQESRHTINIVGSEGYLGMVGYDWDPQGVDLATHSDPKLKRHSTEELGYTWPMGASLVCECLATGKEPLFTPEHALHVVEIIAAARESQRTGNRVDLKSRFKWPVGA